MKKIVRTVLCSVIIGFLLQGCMMEIGFTAQQIEVPVSMTSQLGRPYITVRHFSVTQDRSALFIKRLWGGGLPDIHGMIERELKKTPGDAVVNLSIQGAIQPGDVALPVVIGIAGVFVFPPMIFFLFEPLLADFKSFSVEGDIVNFTDVQQTKKIILPSIDPTTGLPIHKEEKKIEYDPVTGLPKKLDR